MYNLLSTFWSSSPFSCTMKCSTKWSNDNKREEGFEVIRERDWTASEKGCVRRKLKRKEASIHCSETCIFSHDSFQASVQKKHPLSCLPLHVKILCFEVFYRAQMSKSERDFHAGELGKKDSCLQASKSIWWIWVLFWVLTRPISQEHWSYSS